MDGRPLEDREIVMEERKEDDVEYEDPAIELFYESMTRQDEKKLKEACLCKKDRKIKRS